MSEAFEERFESFLREFRELPKLSERLAFVFQSLPRDVRQDFLEDTRFRVSLERYVPGRGYRVFFAVPGSVGSGSRSVVLRRKLETASRGFACWVIAHELAHAYLRHGDGGDMSDVEGDANRLAAEWGFPRPA